MPCFNFSVREEAAVSRVLVLLSKSLHYRLPWQGAVICLWVSLELVLQSDLSNN